MLFIDLRVICLLSALTASFAARADPRRHIDDKAGISYPIINRAMRPKPSTELSKLNSAPSAKAARITYTSGYFVGKQKTPYMLVWTMPLDQQLTRSAIDSLKDSDNVFRMLGIKDWRFDLKRLRGRGIGERRGALRSEVIMHVLRGRYTYIGYFYELDEQLQDWRRISAGIQPTADQKIDYQALPANAASSALSAMGQGALVGSLLGGLGFLAWALFKRQKRQISKNSDGDDFSKFAA